MTERGRILFDPRALTASLPALALALLPGCTKGGQISSSSSVGSGNGLLTISKIYPTDSGESWSPITASGRLYIKGLKLTITGVCSRGTEKIRVSEGAGPYAETTNCTANGDFKWSKVFVSSTEEGDKTLTVTAFDASDAAIAGASAQVQVRIDDTPPPPPSITIPNVSPYTIPTSFPVFTIEGTTSADTYRLQLPGADNFMTPANGQWSLRVDLVPGQTRSYDFYAYDLAGNRSPVTQQVLSWFPVVDAKVAGVFPGGTTSDTEGLGCTLKSSVTFTQSKTTDSNTGFTMETGFHFLSKSARGL